MRLPLRTRGKLMLATFRSKLVQSKTTTSKTTNKGFWREQSTLGFLST